MFGAENTVRDTRQRAEGSAAASRERRERRFDQTRSEILAAARAVMLEVGAARLSLREVARRAQFSPAALYTYFSGRDEIIDALTTESFRLLSTYLDAVPNGLPPDERLVQLGMAYMSFAEENPADLLCILSPYADDPAVSADVSIGLAAARLLSETLREGIASGLFRPLDEPQLARTAFGMWALVHGMTALATVSLGPVSDQIGRDPRGVIEDYIAALRPPKQA